jgi:hypothetical protein
MALADAASVALLYLPAAWTGRCQGSGKEKRE